MIVTLGVDPGISKSAPGAMALLIDGDFAAVEDWCDSLVMLDTLRHWNSQTPIALAALERVGARPGQGISTTGKFLENHGWWMGIMDGLFGSAWVHPTPQTWQRTLVPRKSIGVAKPSLDIARVRFPTAPLKHKKNHGRADALLIAYWAYLELCPWAAE